VFETFCKLHPGVPLLELHGKQKQQKRAETYAKFAAQKAAYLFCTDIAARGLDFAAVNWVIQLDCPEDPETYIHRVGRTARYEASGQAMLMLCPSEEAGMVSGLEKAKVPILEVKQKQDAKDRKEPIQKQMQRLCFNDPEIKYLGQKAFISYMRSVYLQKDKVTFDVNALPAETFASSLGLPGAPKIKFVEKKNKEKNAVRGNQKKTESDVSDDEEDAQEDEEEEKSKVKALDTKKKSKKEAVPEAEEEESSSKQAKSKIEKMFNRKNQGVLAEHYTKLVDHESDSKDKKLSTGEDSDEDFMTIKRVNHDLGGQEIPEDAVLPSSRRQQRMSKLEKTKNVGQGEKLLFDDEGRAHEMYELEDEASFHAKGDAKSQQQQFLEKEKKVMDRADVDDKALSKEKLREKKARRKQREKEEMDVRNRTFCSLFCFLSVRKT